MKQYNVVFEGPDNTGKTTLIEKLSKRLPHRPVIHSGGPEKHPGEIDERIANFLDTHHQVIYDRHPAVSEQMYGFMRDAPGPSNRMIELFYRTQPILIYCRPVVGRDLTDHNINPEIDTPEHLDAVTEHYGQLWESYDIWALQYAHFVYRIGDDSDRLLNAIVGILTR